ncbi:hypothetical protein TNCV_3899771 [Trichonephila clavipes]|nr:hypothetical protein TNCV_3899771 [Trichonephila clavipes]
MNSERCIEILTRFMKRLHRVRPHYAQGSWFFVHFNACPHSANMVKQFLGIKRGRIDYPPFFPDFNAPELPIPTARTRFERKIIDDISDIQRNEMRLFNCISKEDFLRNFQDMYSTDFSCA